MNERKYKTNQKKTKKQQTSTNQSIRYSPIIFFSVEVCQSVTSFADNNRSKQTLYIYCFFFLSVFSKAPAKMNMYRSNLTFIDLPNEIILFILKKLNNMDVLYSLLDVDNERLDMIIQTKTFTESLDFTLTTPSDDILLISDSILNRFCIDILPKIDHSIRSLTLESTSMERILLVASYPNLTELKLFNFTDSIASCHFTGKYFHTNLNSELVGDVIYIASIYLLFFSI